MRHLIAVLGILALLAVPTTAGATPTSGLIFAQSVTLTPISQRGNILKLRLNSVATETGGLTGSSVANNVCFEDVTTGQANCSGPETFTGTVDGIGPGTVVFANTYAINFTTGVTAGTSQANGGSLNVHGSLAFSGNAFSQSGLPYSGDLVVSAA